MNGASRWLDAWTAPAAASSAAAQARASGVSDQSLRFMRFSSLVAERPARAQDAPIDAAPGSVMGQKRNWIQAGRIPGTSIRVRRTYRRGVDRLSPTMHA